MTFSQILSPIFRQKWIFLGLFILLGTGIFFAQNLLPERTKTTLYFTVKPVLSRSSNVLGSGVEDAERIAETVAGWVQDPGFREKILTMAKVKIPNFKQKISASKQNRMNVFYTLNLFGKNQKHTKALVNAIEAEIDNIFKELSNENLVEYKKTDYRIHFSYEFIPATWWTIISIFGGFLLSLLLTYSKESLAKVLQYEETLLEIFPNTPILRINKKVGQHDEQLLEKFIITFESPRVIGTFKQAQKHFSLTDLHTIDPATETPIFLVKLGQTKKEELQNMKAIFGQESVGVVLF